MGRLSREQLHTDYPSAGKLLRARNLGGDALLQRNLGGAQNCTITSLAFLFGAERYGEIERLALHRGYFPKWRGTNPFFIRAIMYRCRRRFGVSAHCRVAYGKGVMFTYRRIQRIIDGGEYLLLNLLRDGRGYYRDHTVTVIGYEEYEHARFLLLYDNWNAAVSYLDYDKLSPIASINWLSR